MEIARKQSCGRRVYFFLWQDREHLYNKTTMPAPYMTKNKLFIARFAFFLITQAVFWLNIAIELSNFFKLFTGWMLFLQMTTFTLLILSHLQSFYYGFKADDDQLVSFQN